MTRLVGTLLLLTLVTPLALAAAPDAPLADATREPTLPDLRPLGRALADGAVAAGNATGAAFAAVADALAALAAATARAFAAAFSALASAAAATGAALAALAGAIGAGLAALASALAAAGLAGARFVAAHPKESAIVAGSASGAGLLAWAAKKWWLSLFVPLYSRLAKSDMLENRVRASVFEHVRARPGVHPSAIADALGLGWGTVVYHLARLEESSLVTTRSAHNRKCYFVVGGDLDSQARGAVAAMSTDKARAIVEALRAQPGVSQKTLAESLGMSQALASWHVKRLVQSGVVVSTRAGRSNLLHVAEHVPVVSAPVKALAA